MANSVHQNDMKSINLDNYRQPGASRDGGCLSAGTLEILSLLNALEVNREQNVVAS